jgi:hypothetical protein
MIPHDRPTFETACKELQGATILDFGFPNEAGDLEGGGLVIDYLPKGMPHRRRLVFAFNENGMWVDHLSLKSD